MRLFTTNGMDEKEIKGHTNPSKQDVQRWPSEKVRVSPTGRVYQYSQKNFGQIASPEGRKIVPANLDWTKLPLYQGTMDDGVSLPLANPFFLYRGNQKTYHIWPFGPWTISERAYQNVPQQGNAQGNVPPQGSFGAPQGSYGAGAPGYGAPQQAPGYGYGAPQQQGNSLPGYAPQSAR
jgi:hypothetical protein